MDEPRFHTRPCRKDSKIVGISLSPDTTKMAVADASAGVVYLIDLPTRLPSKRFPANPTPIPRWRVSATFRNRHHRIPGLLT